MRFLRLDVSPPIQVAQLPRSAVGGHCTTTRAYWYTKSTHATHNCIPSGQLKTMRDLFMTTHVASRKTPHCIGPVPCKRQSYTWERYLELLDQHMQATMVPCPPMLRTFCRTIVRDTDIQHSVSRTGCTQWPLTAWHKHSVRLHAVQCSGVE